MFDTISQDLPNAVPAFTAEEADVWKSILAARDLQRPEPLDEGERAELLNFQKEIGAEPHDSLRENIESLGDAGTLAVVTGQQAGLLGGPLYTFYKAAGAVILAARLQKSFGRRVIPIFWIAGDDHDYDEAARADWLDADGELVTHRLLEPAEEYRGRPVSSIPLGTENFTALADRLRQSVPSNVDIDSALRKLGEETESGAATLEMAFARLMARLFQGTGLVFVAPRLDFLRRRGMPVMRREIESPLESTRLVVKAGEELASRGDSPSLHRAPDAVNFFLLEDGVRCRVAFDQGNAQFVVRTPGRDGRIVARYSAEDLLERLQKAPDQFSPNVVTRPIVQDASLPSVAYGAGPGEAAYFRQLGAVYDFHQTWMPEIVRRPSAVLIEPRIARAMKKLEITEGDIAVATRAGRDGNEELKKRALNNDEIESLEKQIESVIEEFNRISSDLVENAPGRAVNVKRAAGKLQSSLSKPLGKLSEAIAKDRENLSEGNLVQWRKVEAALFPEHSPQERILNIQIPFLASQGEDFSRLLLLKIAQNPAEDPIVIMLAELR